MQKVSVITTNSHAESISPASCRSKRVDDHSRFYANFRDFVILYQSFPRSLPSSDYRGESNHSPEFLFDKVENEVASKNEVVSKNEVALFVLSSWVEGTLVALVS